VRKLLLEECGNNLPFRGKVDSLAMDRFRFAVLKLSGGDWAKLPKAIELAKQDWRGLLVIAGFGYDPRAHMPWLPGKRILASDQRRSAPINADKHRSKQDSSIGVSLRSSAANNLPLSAATSGNILDFLASSVRV
jgi:hypothetical protein